MKFSAWFCIFVAAALTACETVQTTQGGLVGVERRQSMSSLISASQIDRSAVEAYGKVISEADKKNQLNRDSAQVERVRGVANRLIPSTAAFRADAPRWNWEINVITSPEVNAWCMPGGKIAVYSGLLTKLDPTDEELAAVMGHEIAHALRERASEQAAQQLGISVLSAALGLGDQGAQLTQTLLDVTLSLPHSRTHETEADRIGVELAARPGYDPRAAVSLWQKVGGARIVA